jgi:hypothetical protein
VRQAKELSTKRANVDTQTHPAESVPCHKIDLPNDVTFALCFELRFFMHCL